MRINFTHAVFDDHIEELGKPSWPDGCGHKRSEWVGTVKTWPDGYSKPMEPVDVYVHEGDIGVNEAHVCIRFGAEGCQYVSAGSVLDMLVQAARRPAPPYYREVACLLVKKLDFFCEQRALQKKRIRR